jgi:hypothetical protein
MTVVTVAIYMCSVARVAARGKLPMSVKSACREHEIRTGLENGEAFWDLCGSLTL